MSDTVREVVGIFHDAKSLEKAADALMSGGIDRSLLSLIATEDVLREKLGGKLGSAEDLADDESVPRISYADHSEVSLGQGALISGLFYVGAMIGTGVVFASGGAPLVALIAGTVGGVSAGGIGAALSMRLGQVVAGKVEDEVARGGLILWARTPTPESEEKALKIMRDCGAYDVHAHGLPDADPLEQNITPR